MFGRITRLLLAALVTEVGGAVIQAGRGWVEGKLSPPPAPSPPVRPTTEPEALLPLVSDGRRSDQ